MASFAIIAGTVLALNAAVPAASAAAVPAAPSTMVTTINPFAVSNGFTVYSLGDVSLGNGEIEGSVAAEGAISTPNTNGYPVIHSAAGQPDYLVPTIDGVPVRILAGSFAGTGAFDVSNRDDSGTIAATSAEANATVKLVETDGLSGSKRGGGVNNAAGVDFLRVTNTAAGIIDLKSVPHAGSSIDALATVKASVGAYFPDRAASLTTTSNCLAALYTDEQLAHVVDLGERDGMLYPSGFATDRPNVISFADVAGKTIKMDAAGGYRPTAAAPLVIRVANGTTAIGAIAIEGWNPGASQDQGLARYILLDLSAVTNPVTINGLTMGAVYAPSAHVTFSSGVTTNGQWIAAGVRTQGGGELHHQAFLGQIPCVSDDPVTGEVPDPEISSSVTVGGSAEKILPVDGGRVVDTVFYENLVPGTEYTLEGHIMTADAQRTPLSASVQFVPTEPQGSIGVTFTVSAEHAASLSGQKLVVFQYLSADGVAVAEHADIDSVSQSFRVAVELPTESPSDDDPADTPSDGKPAELVVAGADGIVPAIAGALLLGTGLVILLVRRRASRSR